METLLRKTEKISDESEVFFNESRSCTLSVENGTLKNLGGNMTGGYAIRIIRKKNLGSSYLNNLRNREAAGDGAVLSLAGKVGAEFSFPGQSKIASIESYDKRVESLNYSDLLENSEEISNYLEGEVKGQLNLYNGFNRKNVRIINSGGLDRKARTSYVYSAIHMIYPKTSNGVYQSFYSVGPKKIKKKLLDEILETYKATIPTVEVSTGNYPVLFMTDALFPILWRIFEGANGKNLFKNTSPLTGKAGKHVFSESISVINNPLDTAQVNPCAFDDEGVSTRKLKIIDRGVFKSCFVNLDYAAKLNMKPTGTGFRSEFFMPGNPIRTQPVPLLKHMSFATGKDKFGDMVGSMARGIIVSDIIGPHSGNILNGDFSVGLAPGYFVKNGEIVGRVKDGLISGNIYELLKEVAGIEDRVHFPDDPNGNPSMLFDGVRVSAK
jgi:PmbA protein